MAGKQASFLSPPQTLPKKMLTGATHQRLKDAVDAQIEKETTRQRQTSATPAQSSPRSRPRAGSRPLSPSRRKRRDGDDSAGQRATPDPADFDQDFAIGDNSEATTRTGTPVSRMNGDSSSAPPKENGTGAQGAKETPEVSERTAGKYADLPQDVQQRLRKLDRLEPRYRDLVSSYKIAHEKAVAVDAFETALREHTPLASIQDPGALIEFMQQNELKTSLVMDELRRAITEKDELRKKLEDAEKVSKPSSDEPQESTSKDQARKDSDEPQEDSEDFFSYESEVPRLQREAKEYEDRVVKLESENKSLKDELESSKASAEQLARNLQSSSSDIASLKDLSAKHEDESKRQKELHESLVNELRGNLEEAERVVQSHKTGIEKHQGTIQNLQEQLSQAQDMSKQSKGLDQKVQKLEKELSEAQESTTQQEKRNATLNNLVQTLRNQLKVAAEVPGTQLTQDSPSTESSQLIEPAKSEAAAGGKKKKNKKKKGGKAPDVADEGQLGEDDKKPDTGKETSKDSMAEDKLILLQQELESLHTLCEDKDNIISKLQAKIKDQEALEEEIETLRDDIVHHGTEHVGAKDKIKQLQAEKAALQETISKLENEALELRAQHDSHADTTQAHQNLSTDFSDLKVKADALETSLVAAEKLATSRFKELTDMREIMQRAQPELQSLRSEVTELRKSKEELASKITEVKKLEGREKDLRNDISRYKKQLTDRDADVRGLNEKVSQATMSKRDVEEASRRTQRELQRTQNERKDALETKEKLSKELSKTQEELHTAKVTLQRLEQQVSKLHTDAQGLRDEITLKTAQYASAQSLMNSMQDQTQELGTQMKEIRERCESLEEELADAHRLLSERSREGEKLRRLAADAEGRAESRIKEMREQMDVAIEERDRAEEQASTMSRKRTRELEELKAKIRDAEIGLRRAEQEKEELEITHRDVKRQRDEFEKRSIRATDEMTEVRDAMSQLREALDETEKQARELEKEKVSLKQSLDDTQHQLEKVQKSTKSMTEDVKSLKQQLGQSSRSSLESARSPGRLASPPPRNTMSPAGQSTAAGGKVDYVYLKNVLLQFMEQKDKKHQMSLVPVLGMLLHFDR